MDRKTVIPPERATALADEAVRPPKAGDVRIASDGASEVWCADCQQWEWTGHAHLKAREVCICAAVRLDDGYIVRGHRHDDCIQTVGKLNAVKLRCAGPVRQDMQGFVTSLGRFVDRSEGARLMREAGHVSAMLGRKFEGAILFSEDLY